MGNPMWSARGARAIEQETLPEFCAFCGADTEHVLIAEGDVIEGGSMCSRHRVEHGPRLRWVVSQWARWCVWASPDELERHGGAWLIMPNVHYSVD